eukprot:Skav221428  [mRNA]  locus=scaffold4477:20117:21991:+ [translate_table: standard]
MGCFFRSLFRLSINGDGGCVSGGEGSGGSSWERPRQTPFALLRFDCSRGCGDLDLVLSISKIFSVSLCIFCAISSRAPTRDSIFASSCLLSWVARRSPPALAARALRGVAEP